MTSCTFHDTAPAARERQLFEIVELAFSQRRKVLVLVRDEARAALVDRMLWILKQEAFIPHKIFAGNETDPDVRVAIVCSEWNPISADVLVVESHCTLDFACDFDSVHEFVDRSTPELHQACRDRFRDYRSRQIAVEYSK
jgi:DNA polymerase IIIc chi subunit